MKRVIKRDGSVVEFDKGRIINAIRKTFEQASREPNMKLIEKIASQVEDLPDKVLAVEQIQDIVVKKLMGSSEKDIAMSYQSYRTLKAEIREKEKGIYRQIGELVDASNKKLLSENANKDAKTISVQRDLLAGISSRDYYLNKIVPKHIKLAHIKGEIHLHDLDYYFLEKQTVNL